MKVQFGKPVSLSWLLTGLWVGGEATDQNMNGSEAAAVLKSYPITSNES